MRGFTLLWNKILDSSIWITGTKETRLVWITLLAMRDQDGKVSASLIGLADRAKVTPAECRAALKVLLSPDPDDTSKVDQGRRIREIQGGWEIVNHDLYRFSTEAKREFWRTAKAEQRQKKAKKTKPSKPLPGEKLYQNAMDRGDQAEADRLSDPDFLREQSAEYLPREAEG